MKTKRTETRGDRWIPSLARLLLLLAMARG